MSYSEIAELLDNPVITRRLVTLPMGGWKWGKAYAVSQWRLLPNADETHAVWRHLETGPKYSLPQIKRFGIEFDGIGRPGP